MPRLALIRQNYRPDGGAERFISRALLALSESGVELNLITRQWQESGNFRVLACNPPIWGRVSRERAFAEQAMRICQQESFDLVQSHERIPGCSLFRAGDGVHRRWLDIRKQFLPSWKCGWQEYSRFHRYVLHAEKAMFEDSRLRAVICNSHMVKDEIIHYYALPESRIHVIYNGIDCEQFHPRNRQHRPMLRAQLGIPEAATLFLFVGSGFERKNLGLVIDALGKLDLDTHLAIVGRDSSQRKYQRRAQQLGVEARCHFLGVRQDLPALYGMADALVLPTWYDPFPNVILEAMASGLPVLTSSHSGGRELIGQEAGAVIAPDDCMGLAGKMHALQDAEKAHTMGSVARSRVEHLSPAELSSQLLGLYTQLLSS